jgi:ribosome modulation factor
MPLDQAGSNTASNDSAVDWTRQYRKQKRLCEEANGVLRNIVKRAKSDGVNTTAMINAVKASKLDPEVVAQDLRDQIRYMGLIHIPLTQASLFEGFDTTISQQTQREDDLWDAEDAGYKAGRHGVRIEECPYTPGTELHVHWLEWWNKGQAAIARELGPDVKVAGASKTRRKRATQRALTLVSDTYVPSAATMTPTRKPRRKKAGNGASPRA